MSTTKNFLSKKVIIVVAVLAVGALSVVLVASSLAQATAQQEQQKRMMMMTTTWPGQGMPQINGSVSIANMASNFINENVKASFVSAAQTAQGQVTNGTVLGGHMSIVQGYLVYTFFVADAANQTGHFVVIDAGNGDVLYNSEGQSLGSFGNPMMFGARVGQGFGEWHGLGNLHGFGGGMWH